MAWLGSLQNLLGSLTVDFALVISDTMHSMLVGSPGNEVVSVPEAATEADGGNSGPGGDGKFETSRDVVSTWTEIAPIRSLGSDIDERGRFSKGDTERSLDCVLF
jgi:hypothetical protein